MERNLSVLKDLKGPLDFTFAEGKKPQQKFGRIACSFHMFCTKFYSIFVYYAQLHLCLFEPHHFVQNSF